MCSLNLFVWCTGPESLLNLYSELISIIYRDTLLFLYSVNSPGGSAVQSDLVSSYIKVLHFSFQNQANSSLFFLIFFNYFLPPSGLWIRQQREVGSLTSHGTVMLNKHPLWEVFVKKFAIFFLKDDKIVYFVQLLFREIKNFT